MKKGLSLPRVLLLALLTAAIIVGIFVAALYAHNYSSMREADILYNTGDYTTASARYHSLKDAFGFRKEAAEKEEYCNYNLGVSAMEEGNWDSATRYFSTLGTYMDVDVDELVEQCTAGMEEAEAEAVRAEAEAAKARAEAEAEAARIKEEAETAKAEAAAAKAEAETAKAEAETAKAEAEAVKAEAAAKAEAEAKAAAERAKAEEEAANTVDARFLADLEKALMARAEEEEKESKDEISITTAEQYALERYRNKEFEDATLKGYATEYLDAVGTQVLSLAETNKAEAQLRWNEANVERYAILNRLYEEYGFMADNNVLYREYIANAYQAKQFADRVQLVNDDIKSQVSGQVYWTSPNLYTASHAVKNNTPYTVSLLFYFDMYNGAGTQYVGQETFRIVDIPPETEYKVTLTSNEIQNYVKFYIDWQVLDVK